MAPGGRGYPGRAMPRIFVAQTLVDTWLSSGRVSLERDLIVLPKSTHRERIEANAQVFDFSLSAEDVAALDALDTTGGTDRALESRWW